MENMVLLHRSSNWYDRVIRESIEINLANGNILNEEEGISLSKVVVIRECAFQSHEFRARTVLGNNNNQIVDVGRRVSPEVQLTRGI